MTAPGRSQSLLESFNYAFEGIIHVLRTQRNLRLHFLIAVAVIVGARGVAGRSGTGGGGAMAGSGFGVPSTGPVSTGVTGTISGSSSGGDVSRGGTRRSAPDGHSHQLTHAALASATSARLARSSSGVMACPRRAPSRAAASS